MEKDIANVVDESLYLFEADRSSHKPVKSVPSYAIRGNEIIKINGSNNGKVFPDFFIEGDKIYKINDGFKEKKPLFYIDSNLVLDYAGSNRIRYLIMKKPA